MELTLAISMLQLLYSIYTEQRRRSEAHAGPDPQVIRDIIEEFEAGEGETIELGEIERRIEEKFGPEQAKVVKADLALFNLLVTPPNMDAFDYWGLLIRFVGALQELARQNRMFDLRGRNAAQGVTLDLPLTSEKLLPRHRMEPALRPYNRESVGGIESISAVMFDSGTDLPIRVVVIATFELYGGIPGDVRTDRDFAIYQLGVGQRPHWIRFTLAQNAPHFAESFEFMLTGPEFKLLLQALRDDIHGYIRELNADEALMAPLFEQIDRFVGRIRQSTLGAC